MRKSDLIAPLFAIACATAGTNPATNPNYKPPQIISTATPTFYTPRSLLQAAELDISVEVMIDSAGHPDMSSFHATGNAASANEASLRQWVEMADFKPAVQDGIPVRGKFTVMFRGIPGGSR